MTEPTPNDLAEARIDQLRERAASTPEAQARLKADLDARYGPVVVAVPREDGPAPVKTLAQDMEQRLADDDRAFTELKERIESLNLYEEFKDVVPYRTAKPRTIPISRALWNDHPLVKQILEWANAYRAQRAFAAQFKALSEREDADLETSMEALRSALKADAQAADYRSGIDALFKDTYKVLADVYKKRLDAALAHAAAQQKHRHHKEILASKGFGDPNQMATADVQRIAGSP